MKKIGIRHILASGLLALSVLQAPGARASIVQPAKRVVSTKQIPFTSAVYVGNTTAPEWVLFRGNLIVASDVKAPSGTCTADAPCSLPAGVLALSTGITGVGLSSGLTYQLAGLSLAFDCNLQVPGPFSFQRDFIAVLPRNIRPVGRLLVTVPMKFVVTFDSSAKILEAAVPPTGLVSWWQGEGTGLDALGVNNGTLSTTEPVSFVTGKVGQAFHFTNQGLVTAPDSPSLDSANVTVAAWVRSTAPGAFSYVLSKGAFECSFSSYGLYVPQTGGLEFYITDGINFFPSPDASPALWDGTWHFVAGAFDGKAVHLYVDGNEVGPATPAPVAIDYQASDNNNFYIGAFHDTCQKRFPGDIDEVQVYNRALLAPELMGLYSAQY